MLKLKKVIFSLSLLGVSLLTMVATTFAWVGITSNSSFDEFSIGLKTDNDTGAYGIQLSLTGKTGSYHESIDSISIRKQILKNLGESPSLIDNAKDSVINSMFTRFKMDQCTPKINDAYPNIFSGNDVQTFETVVGKHETIKFIYFDVYVSLYIANATAQSSSSAVSLFLRDGLLSSDDIGHYELYNEFTYPNSPVTIGGVNYSFNLLGQKIKKNIRVNPASAARVCIQRFEPVDVSDAVVTPIDYTIYQYDSNLPSYNHENNLYSFGGILPKEYNVAYQQFASIYTDTDLGEVPDWQLNRGDIEYADSGNIGRLCDESTGFSFGKKMKFRIYFWFEGWDSDCFDVIDRRTVNLNLSFSNKGPNDV